MLSCWLPGLGGLHGGGEGKGWFCPHAGSLGQGVLSLLLALSWDPTAQENGVLHPYITCTPSPTPCLDSTAPLPGPYLPTAKTVRPMVRFCCTASCWATSGSKVPSQIMGALQQVQVRTLGQALPRAGMERQVHSSTCLMHGHRHLPSPGP